MGDRFSIEKPRKRALRTGGAEGPEGCLQRIGELGGGGAKFYFFLRGRNVHQDFVGPRESFKNSMPNMTGRPGYRTMEEVPRRTSLVPLAFPCFVHCSIGVEIPGAGRDHFHCTVEPSPGVERNTDVLNDNGPNSGKQSHNKKTDFAYH